MKPMELNLPYRLKMTLNKNKRKVAEKSTAEVKKIG
jgi:hypothetical protein